MQLKYRLWRPINLNVHKILQESDLFSLCTQKNAQHILLEEIIGIFLYYRALLKSSSVQEVRPRIDPLGKLGCLKKTAVILVVVFLSNLIHLSQRCPTLKKYSSQMWRQERLCRHIC